MGAVAVSCSLECLQVLEGHTDRVWNLAWSPDGACHSPVLLWYADRSHAFTAAHDGAGSSLASCSSDMVVRIWKQSQKQGKGWICSVVLEDTHTKSIRCCCWSPGGTHLASASFDGTTSIWDVQQGHWEEVIASIASSPKRNCVPKAITAQQTLHEGGRCNCLWNDRWMQSWTEQNHWHLGTAHAKSQCTHNRTWTPARCHAEVMAGGPGSAYEWICMYVSTMCASGTWWQQAIGCIWQHTQHQLGHGMPLGSVVAVMPATHTKPGISLLNNSPGRNPCTWWWHLPGL